MSDRNWYSKKANTGRSLVSPTAILAMGMILTLGGCDRLPSSKSAAKQGKGTGQINTRLETIKNRGKLICGIDDFIPGFSYKEADGSYSGISVDLCRAIAAALFNDASKVEYRHLQPEERFAAVATGKVDLLSLNTTWNLSRDTAGGLDFPPINFYDGQGLLVHAESGINNLDDLSGKSVCVIAGTTSEENLLEQLRKYNVSYQPLLLDNLEQVNGAYETKQCQAFTSDRSQLVIYRSQLGDPDAHQVLGLTFSKEPLGPVIKNGESDWLDVVKWVSYGTIKAEDLGISSENINSLKDSTNPEIRRFLGLEGDLGTRLKLSNDFARRIVEQVGNYDEIYKRNIGNPYGLERGTNALWKNGGLMYSPPFR